MDIRTMREIREKRGYSYARLSEYSGVPAVTIQKIFSGKTKHPRKATLDALEKVLSGEESTYRGKASEYNAESAPLPVSASFGCGKTPAAGKPTYSGMGTDEGIGCGGMLGEEEVVYGTKKQGEYTLDDYYALPDERRVELIDGVFYDMSSPRTVHQSIAGVIFLAISNHIRKNKGDCRAFIAPVDVQLDCDDRTMVQPDVLVVCDRSKIKGFGIYGAPDFVAEILSRSTRKKDMSLKLSKYMEAGVREYWMIDPYKRTVITYNFMEEDFIPGVRPLQGKLPVAVFDGALEISLDEIASSIDEYGV